MASHILNLLVLLLYITNWTLFFGDFLIGAEVCHVAARINSSIVIGCQHLDSQHLQSCHIQHHHWQKYTLHSVINVSTRSSKHNIRSANAQQVRNTRTQQQLSPSMTSLRIANLQTDDLGLYQCHVTCQNKSTGTLQNLLYSSAVCLTADNPDYMICNSVVEDNYCTDNFQNGVCNHQCNDEGNLYDGFDCDQLRSQEDSSDNCSLHNGDDYCWRRFANGICDEECDRAGCVWDGGDCVDHPLTFAQDKIILRIHAKRSELEPFTAENKEIRRTLSRSLSILLGIIARVAPLIKSENIRDFSQNVTSWKKEKSTDWNVDDMMTEIVVRLDLTRCRSRCFTKSETAGRFIQLALRKGWKPGVRIHNVEVLTRIQRKCDYNEISSTFDMLPKSVGMKETPPNLATNNTRHGVVEISVKEFWILVSIIAGSCSCIIVIIAVVVVLHRLRLVFANYQLRKIRSYRRRNSSEYEIVPQI